MRILARAEDLQCKTVPKLKAPQAINHETLVIRDIIHTTEVRHPIQSQCRLPDQKLRQLPPILRIHVHARMLILGKRREDFRSERVPDHRNDFTRRHGREYRPPARSVQAHPANQKPETRNPKEAPNPKPEKEQWFAFIRVSGFGHSFGFLVWDFWFPSGHRLEFTQPRGTMPDR